MSVSANGLPIVPPQFRIYNSYAIDPQFSRYFTYSWLGLFALTFLCSGSVLAIWSSLHTHRFFTGWTIYEDTSSYRPVPDVDPAHSMLKTMESFPVVPQKVGMEGRGWKRLAGRARSLGARFVRVGWLPDKFGGSSFLRVDQIALAAVYAGLVWVCVLKDAELKSNPNRFGFLTLAQLTPLFLLSTKNNPLAFFLSTGYEKLNWAHRWVGRMVWLTATCHGATWSYQYGTAYILSNQKAQLGLTAYSFLCLIAITSIRPLRAKCYTLFWIAHLLSIIGFFSAIAYHTPYAQPWIFPPLALYTFDICARLVKVRFMDAVLVPLEGMTLIHLPDANQGWLPGQHVRLGVFLPSWSVFEPTHPFTILSSPSSQPGRPSSGGLTLLASGSGDWTRALHAFALNGPEGGAPVKVLLDGPYGGGLLAESELVIGVAGGSGVSTLLALAEEVRSGWESKTGRARAIRKLALVWVIQDFGTYTTLLPLFNPLLGSDITLAVFVTRSTIPTDLVPPPHTTIHPDRPNLALTLASIINTTDPTSGVTVRACGPADLVAAVGNAVRGLDAGQRGGVSLEAEVYAL